MLIVHGCAALLFVILGIALFCGKGSFLIAGYNTASRRRRRSSTKRRCAAPLDV